MNHIKVSKIYCLDENIVFPICHTRANELSPHAIKEEELNKFSQQTLIVWQQAGLVSTEKVLPDRYLIWLCKHCLKGKIVRDT